MLSGIRRLLQRFESVETSFTRRVNKRVAHSVCDSVSLWSEYWQYALKPDNRLSFLWWVEFLSHKQSKSKKGYKSKSVHSPFNFTLLFFLFFFLVGLSIFISQKKVKNLDWQNFSQFFVITLTRSSVIGEKNSESMSKWRLFTYNLLCYSCKKKL